MHLSFAWAAPALCMLFGTQIISSVHQYICITLELRIYTVSVFWLVQKIDLGVNLATLVYIVTNLAILIWSILTAKRIAMTLKIALLCTVVALLQLEVTSHSGWRPPITSPTTGSPPMNSPTTCPTKSSATCSCTQIIMEARATVSLLPGVVFLQTSHIMWGDPPVQAFCSLQTILAEEHLHWEPEPGFTDAYRASLAIDDPMWDGDGCGPDNSCYNQTGLPWFYRTLPQEVGDDIEVRLCSSDGINNEETYLELVEIYVQWPRHLRVNPACIADTY